MSKKVSMAVYIVVRGNIESFEDRTVGESAIQDTTGKKPVDAAKGGDDKAPARNAFQDEVHSERMLKGSVQKTSDASGTATDRAESRTEVKNEAPVSNPYESLFRADQASKEITALENSGKGAKDTIEVPQGDGSVRTVTVGDRVKELKTIVHDQLETAGKVADGIRQTGPNSVQKLVETNIGQRNQLRDALGIKDSDINAEGLRQLYGSETNPERKAKLEALWGNLQERQDLEKLRHAPAYVRLLGAELQASGHASPEIGFGEPVPRENYSKAFDLMKSAARMDPELETTDIYRSSESRISLLYASNQQERSAHIIEEMRKSTEALQKGDSVEREEHLKKAVELADGIDIGFVASQARLDRNIESGVSSELNDIVTIAGMARLDYAKYLQEMGRADEAQLQLNQVKVDSPYLIYAQDGSGKITYRDPSLEALDRKITLGVNVETNGWETAQTKFMTAVQDGKHEDAERYLAEMQKVNRDANKEVEQSNRVLAEEKIRLQESLAKFGISGENGANPDLSSLSDSDRYEVERIQREMELIDNITEQRESQMSRQENLTRFMDGLLSMSKEDNSRANTIFKEVRDADPELAEIKELGLNDRINETEGGFKGWWHRNWRAVALGAAVVAGVAVAVGTLGVGTAAGAGLVAGVAGTLGVSSATAAGIVTVGTAVTATALGAAAGGGAHWGIERTVNEQAGWGSFMEGAKVGGLSAAMVASPWAASALGATGVGGAAAVANTSRIASMARSVGVTRNTLAAGYSLSGAIEGGNYLTGQKDGTTALRDFAIGGATNTFMVGIAGKWKATSEVLSAGGTSIPRMLGVTKGTAAAGFGISGTMETANYLRGQKTLGDASRDFVTGGAVNTVTLGVLKNYGFSNTVGQSANPYMQASLYGAKTLAFQESFDSALNIGLNKYMQHDILGQNSSIARDGGGFISPLIADGWENTVEPGLNPLHPGESRAISDHLYEISPLVGRSMEVDRKYVDPFKTAEYGDNEQ